MLFITKEEIENYPLSSQRKIIFDDKTLTRGADFSLQRRQAAIDYCQQYSDSGTFCIIVEDKVQLTVWMESQENTPKSIDLPSVPNISNSKVSASRSLNLSEKKINHLIIEMRDSVFGVEIKDRRYKLKVYPRCFIGSDAVKWFMKRKRLTKEEALQVGQKLIDNRIIHHVFDEHQFKDEYLFYRFYMDESSLR